MVDCPALCGKCKADPNAKADQCPVVYEPEPCPPDDVDSGDSGSLRTSVDEQRDAATPAAAAAADDNDDDDDGHSLLQCYAVYYHTVTLPFFVLNEKYS